MPSMANVACQLSELEPHLLGDEHDGGWKEDVPWERARGIRFLCPKCFLANGRSNVGVHSVICWNPSVPQSTPPRPGRWNLAGTGAHDVSLVAGSSSVQINGGCNAHFHVRGGRVEDLT